MDKWLRKYQWALNLVAIALAVGLVASVTNRIVAAEFLAPLTVPKLPPYRTETQSGDADATSTSADPERWDQSLASLCLFGCAESTEETEKECPGGCAEGERCEEGVCVPVEGEESGGQQSDIPVESDLNVKLMGCMVADNPDYSMAMVQDGESQETFVVGPGDYLPEDAEVLEVKRDRIFIRRDGQLEYIRLEKTIGGDPKPVSVGPSGRGSRSGAASGSNAPNGDGNTRDKKLVESSSGDDYVVSKETIDEKLEDPKDLVDDVRVLPNYEDGQRKGIKLVGVTPDGLYSEIGLESGDVLHEVGGEKLNSQKDIQQLIQRFKSRDSLSVVLERDGKKIEKNYRIE